MQYRFVQMTYPWPTDPPNPAHRAAYADAVARPFWLDALPHRESHAPLSDRIDADLCIVGSGYTGLWAALYAKEQDPDRDVVVLEATRCGNGVKRRPPSLRIQVRPSFAVIVAWPE